MSLPNDFTSAFVPLDEASVPRALSAAFAWSRMNTMFASVIAGAVSAAAVAAGGVMLDAAAAESATRALSLADSFFAQAATVTTTKSAMVRVLDMATPPSER